MSPSQLSTSNTILSNQAHLNLKLIVLWVVKDLFVTRHMKLKSTRVPLVGPTIFYKKKILLQLW